MVLFLGIATPALGQDEPCDPAFDINRLLTGLTAAERAVSAPNRKRAREVLESLHRDVPCLPDPVHPRHLVRYGRARALLAYLERRDKEVSYWGQMALLDRAVPWPDRIAETHPARQLIEIMAKRAGVQQEGRGLRAPDGGGVLVDGVALTHPVSSPEAPHLVQVMTRDGRLVQTFWQDGAIWPESMLTDDPAPIGLPVRYAAPHPHLDAYAAVEIASDEQQRRQDAQARAELQRQENEEQHDRAIEKEERREERRRARAAKRGKVAPNADASVVELTDEALAAMDIAETRNIDVYIEDMLPRRDALEIGRSTAPCDDLFRLEPRSVLGRLTDDHILCLQTRLATADRQTAKSKISRLLLADAWAKEDAHRWEGAMRRHLVTIDRSDPDLCYIFASYLADQEEEALAEAMRWADIALQNSHRWEGARRVQRVSALHRINAVAAMKLWLTAEQLVVEEPNRETMRRGAYWRNKTKNLAREWLQFVQAAGVDTRAAYELCLSAAGTVEYCDVE
ncbi:MAG: hypothetical protein KTR31_22205 [Myxococcales bacterium]|nr:hypothetical protein [Myxococcales bacterium]